MNNNFSEQEIETIKFVTEKDIRTISKEIIDFLQKNGYKAEYYYNPTEYETTIIVKKRNIKNYLKIEIPSKQEYLVRIKFLSEDQVGIKPSILTFLKHSQAKKQKGSESDNGFSYYKMYWIFIFVLFLTSFVSFFSWIREEITMYLGIIGLIIVLILLAILFYLIIMSPVYYSKWRKKKKEGEKRKIYQLLKYFANNAKSGKKQSVTCWNCFNKIDKNQAYCPHCGAKL